MKPPYVGIDRTYFLAEELETVWDWLASQAHIWASGMAEPTPADKFAYAILSQTIFRPAKEEEKEDKICG